jgi:ubiquinone/menaquinone biosynthesis C-methylase UbiE
MSQSEKANEHYGGANLLEAIRAALAAAGLGEGVLTPQVLAPLDQFHARGADATIELAREAGIAANSVVLDIGSGLGGPSRYLASAFGCRVYGIDLNASFVEAAVYLSQRAGLDSSVSYQSADALSIPYRDGSFDFVWTQHTAMNIADRDKLYAEAFRVLKPGGRFAIYDVVAGSGAPLHFPVPWAGNENTSFLLSPMSMRDILEAAGFRVISWHDETRAGIEWFEARRAASAAISGTPALGLHVVMGQAFPTMIANFARNLAEGRIGLVQALLERAAQA